LFHGRTGIPDADLIASALDNDSTLKLNGDGALAATSSHILRLDGVDESDGELNHLLLAISNVLGVGYLGAWVGSVVRQRTSSWRGHRDRVLVAGDGD
jgi:hypothetical protein